MKQKTSTSPVRNKSQSKQTPSNSPRKPASSVNTVQKKPAKLSQQAIVLKMKALRQKLCSTLDAYILILETNAPMRCLDHNSVLSLYCQTQQRLLCANCVYRSNNHKLHRVFPIQKCYKQINRDVEQLARQVDREIGWADSQAKAIFQLFKEEEKNTNQAILNLAQIYQQIQFELSKSYEQCKRKIISAMDTIFTKKQSLLLQLQFFKDIYQKNKPANVDQFKNCGDPAITEYHILFNHLIGNALIDFGKLEGMKLSEGPSKIKSLEKQEMVKLKEFKGLMESWREFEREKEGITKEREHDQIKREKEQVIRQKQQELKESQRQRQRVRQINRVKSQTTHRAYF